MIVLVLYNKRGKDMNIAIRKLAMLEKTILEQEERNKIEGFVTSPVNEEFKKVLTDLMLKVRAV